MLRHCSAVALEALWCAAITLHGSTKKRQIAYLHKKGLKTLLKIFENMVSSVKNSNRIAH